MLPSRRLPPRQLASLASRQSSVLRSGTSRKFSSVPRKTAFSAPSCRTSPLRSSNWRAGATSTPNVVLSSSAVRYGSWYAPWSWGRSNAPSDAAPTTSSELTPEPTPVAEPVVTTATPELQPAGIDQPAATTNSSQDLDAKSVEDLLNLAPTPSVDPTTFIDPALHISYWGNLKDLGLDYGWGPAAMFESLLELTYINTELGWAGTIVTSALILRTVLFFTFQRLASDAMVKTAAMKPLLQPVQDEMEEAKKQGDEQRSQLLRLRQQMIMKDVGVDIWKTMGGIAAQAFFGFGAFRSLRGLSTLPVPGMSTGGWAWFPDLTVHDPYYVLPMIAAGTMYYGIKKGGETGMQTETATTGFQKQAQVIMPSVMFAVTAFQPAGLQLYFFCSAVTGLITGLALRHPVVRHVLRIRQLPSPESQKVYSKVIQGELSRDTIKAMDGKVRYRAPNPSRRDSGIKVKPGTALPAHMGGVSLGEKSDKEKSGWENLKPKNIAESFVNWTDPRAPEVRKREARKAQQKAALRKYNEEKKRKLKEDKEKMF